MTKDVLIDDYEYKDIWGWGDNLILCIETEVVGMNPIVWKVNFVLQL